MTKLLAIRRFCYIEVLFRIFYYDLGKENRFYEGLNGVVAFTVNG